MHGTTRTTCSARCSRSWIFLNESRPSPIPVQLPRHIKLNYSRPSEDRLARRRKEGIEATNTLFGSGISIFERTNDIACCDSNASRFAPLRELFVSQILPTEWLRYYLNRSRQTGATDRIQRRNVSGCLVVVFS